MARLKPTVNSLVRGVVPGETVTIKQANLHGREPLEVIYADGGGRTAAALVVPQIRNRCWKSRRARGPFPSRPTPRCFGLPPKPTRIRLGYLFDPLIAVNTSAVDPLPHQITAVYGTMLTRQPLRFLLADDPGAGKTVMTGLLLKELLMRGDVTVPAHRLPPEVWPSSGRTNSTASFTARSRS